MKTIKIFILCIPIQLISQNLVRNPSFENTKKCADTVSLFNSIVKHWSTPTLGTADVFNSCTETKAGVPDNFNGHQVSKFGKKYAGFYFYTEGNYREYIQGSFKSSLKKGTKYKVSFHISLAEKACYAMENIEFLLTKNSFSIATWSELSPKLLENQISTSFSAKGMSNDRFPKEKENWVLLSKVITAKGGENFITIGNFQKNSNTQKRRVSKEIKNKMSYYYLDMVSVELFNNSSNEFIKQLKYSDEKIARIIPTNEIELHTKYKFHEILFDYDRSELSKTAKNEIDMLGNFLRTKKYINLIILGHTDYMGSSSYNKTLSEKRAKSVAEYLIKSGINKTRITSFGYGSSQPLSTSKIDKIRKKNRRVEFILTQRNNK